MYNISLKTYDFNVYCYKSWQALATIPGNFRGMNIDSIWACPHEVEFAGYNLEANSLHGVALFAASLLVLCNVCRAPVASFGRFLAQQTFCKVLRRAFRCNRSRGQQSIAFVLKITGSNNKV